MSSIYIGTSGYSYSDWAPHFYPETLSKNSYLKFYTSEFNAVELNFTYYSMPSPQSIKRMTENTPPHFIFCVKANKSLTHERKGNIGDISLSFIKAIEPLVHASKLGSLLFQFPYSFHYNRESRLYLDSLLKDFKDFPVALEFRNNEWEKDSVFNTLKEREVSFVSVDTPKLNKLPKPSSAVTSDKAYIRFHGRNSKNWWQGSNISRYDYLYSDAELDEWIPRINYFTNHVQMLFIFFNNHYKAQAVFNARTLKQKLKDGGIL